MPYTGIVSNEVSLDHTGPMSPDVLSNALLLRAIAGTDGIDDRQIAGTPSRAHVPNYPALLAAARTRGALLKVGLPSDATGMEPGRTRKMRVGILKEGGMCQAADPRVTERVASAARKFEELGAEVVEISVPGHLDAALIGRVQRYVDVVFPLGRNRTLIRGHADSPKRTTCSAVRAERVSCTSLTSQRRSSRGTKRSLTRYRSRLLPISIGSLTSPTQLFPNSANILINGVYADEHYPQVSAVPTCGSFAITLR